MTNLTHCLAYLSKLPPALSGSGGHNATLRAACECVRFGLTDFEAMQALREYNLRCQPQWSEKELAHKLASARKLATPQAGARVKRSARPGSLKGRDFDHEALDRALAARGLSKPSKTPSAAETTPESPKPEKPLVAPSTPRVAPSRGATGASRTAPDATLAALGLVEGLSGFRVGVPIARQSVEIEERYWAEVWQRLDLPDPANLRRN